MCKKLFASLTLAFAVVPAFADTQSSPILHVDWPAGWKVSKPAMPEPEAGAVPVDIKRVRATKMEAGRVKAAIELTYSPLSKQKGLDTEFAAASQEARKRFEASGKTVYVTPPSETDLGGHYAVQNQMLASDKQTDAKLTFVMAFSKTHAYTLTYSATGVDFGMLQREFQQVRETLKLQD